MQLSDVPVASSMTVLRLPQVKARTGLGRSSIYAQQGAGVFPPCIRIGARAVGWLEYEIDAVVRAWSIGATTNALKTYVAELVTARAGTAAAIWFPTARQ
jgi:prophage regulatory protein